MAIVGALPSVLVNGTPNDAVPLMSDLNFIASQVNANGAQLAGGNSFSGAQVVPASGALNQAAQTQQVQNASYNYCGTAGGAANALTLTPAPAITGYTAGQSFVFIGNLANTGATTVAISGLGGPKAINWDGGAIPAGMIQPGKLYRITYGGAAFSLEALNILPYSSFSSISNPGPSDNMPLWRTASGNQPYRATLEQMFTCINGFTNKAAPIAATDPMLIYSAADGAARQTKLSSFTPSTTVAGVPRMATTAELLAGASSALAASPGQWAGLITSGGGKCTIKFPGGLMINAGETACSNGGFVADTFHTNFSSAIFGYSATALTGAPVHIAVQFSSVGLGGFNIGATNPAFISTTAGWIVVGI